MQDPPPRLYEPESIAIATFLGSPLAGAALWAVNEHRVGRAGRAALAVAAGVGALGLLVLLGQALPTGAMTGATVGVTFGARAAARGWHDAVRSEGLVTEPAFESRWKAAGAGLGFLVLILGGAFGFGALSEMTRARFEVRPGATVYYDAPVTEPDARAVAAALGDLGFFEGDHAVDVFVADDAGTRAVSLVVEPSFVAQPGIEDEFHVVAGALAERLGGTVELRLCDGMLEPHHRYRAP